jgi:hypothetical protein
MLHSGRDEHHTTGSELPTATDTDSTVTETANVLGTLSSVLANWKLITCRKGNAGRRRQHS